MKKKKKKEEINNTQAQESYNLSKCADRVKHTILNSIKHFRLFRDTAWYDNELTTPWFLVLALRKKGYYKENKKVRNFGQINFQSWKFVFNLTRVFMWVQTAQAVVPFLGSKHNRGRTGGKGDAGRSPSGGRLFGNPSLVTQGGGHEERRAGGGEGFLRGTGGDIWKKKKQFYY